MVLRAREIRFAFDRAIVLTLCVIENDTDPDARGEFRVAVEGADTFDAAGVLLCRGNDFVTDLERRAHWHKRGSRGR
jgi:hypothetical protein